MSTTSRVKEVRRLNLAKAFSESRLKTHKEFAEKLGMHATRLSQLISGKATITDNQARDIEHHLHLKRHWLDSKVIRFYVQVSTEKLEEEQSVSPPQGNQNASSEDKDAQGNKKEDKEEKEPPIITALKSLNTQWDGDIKPVKKAEWILGKYDLLLTVELLDIDDIHTFISMLHHTGKVKRTETILTIKSTERFD